MSFAGIGQFRKNLDALMDSDAFKNANEGERLRMGGMLVRSTGAKLDKKKTSTLHPMHPNNIIKK